VPTIEERMAAVEARLDTLGDLRALVIELREDMHRRFDAVDRRFDAVDRRFEAVDRRFEFNNQRFESLIEREDRHFRTSIAVQTSVALMMIATLLTLALR